MHVCGYCACEGWREGGREGGCLKPLIKMHCQTNHIVNVCEGALFHVKMQFVRICDP